MTPHHFLHAGATCDPDMPTAIASRPPRARPRLSLLGWVLALFVSQAVTVRAEISPIVSFQGRVSVAGQPFTGPGQFKFAVLADGGALQLWNSDGSSNAEPVVWVNVAVSNGVFTVPLGDVTLPGMAALPASVFQTYGETQLRIWFNDGVYGFAQLSPDQQLTAAPYALRASRADTVPDGSINAQQLAPGAASGNLGSNSIAGWQLAPGAAVANLAPGSITGSHLAAGSALQNLSASGVGFVPPGGIVLSDLEVNSQFLAAGYTPLGFSNVVATNRWLTLPDGPPAAGASTQNSARYAHAAVWTGTEMLIYGGYPVRFGLRYNAAGNSWSFMSTVNAPEINNCVGFWTGSRFVVWDLGKGTGARYNPATDTWQAIATVGSPGPRVSASAVWTGTEIIIVGGHVAAGARYNPATDTWTAMSLNNAPTPRGGASVVWTGSRLLVFGGESENYVEMENPCEPPNSPVSFPVTINIPTILATGRQYNPATDTWTAMASAPEPRAWHKAVWTGTEMLVYGGFKESSHYCAPEGGFFDFDYKLKVSYDPGRRGYRYNPTANTWSLMTTNGQPLADRDFTALWTGSEMIVVGLGPEFATAQARYNPAANTWSAMSTAAAPTPRAAHSAVWTGSQMILWGGIFDDTELADGARYTPGANWTALPSVPPAFSEPSERFNAASVWTGSELIVWGGQTTDLRWLRSGGIFRPSTGTWTNLPLAGSPSPRANATAVWTGTEMLIWGGSEQFTQQGTGGRYKVASDTWSSISMVGAPSRRSGHSAVWTGTEMIIWGGYYLTNGFDLVYLKDGARYNPVTDSWKPMTNSGVFLFPSAFHTATWTGTEMVVVGGQSESGNSFLYLNTIHRYNPTNNTWSLGALFPTDHRRYGHSAVWTGSELLVWGGRHTNDLKTGFRYNPANNSVAELPAVNMQARISHTAVWTGQHMIIHGGMSASTLGDTALFDPIANRWTAGPPISGRRSHIAAWTGKEMLVVTGKNFNDLADTFAFQPAKIFYYYQK